MNKLASIVMIFLIMFMRESTVSSYSIRIGERLRSSATLISRKPNSASRFSWERTESPALDRRKSEGKIRLKPDG